MMGCFGLATANFGVDGDGADGRDRGHRIQPAGLRHHVMGGALIGALIGQQFRRHHRAALYSASVSAGLFALTVVAIVERG
jgi:hypothetical protein